MTDLQGVTLTPDSLSFTTDDVAPTVVSSSINNGDVLSPGTITEVVTFSEPVQPASVDTFDFSLYGIGRGTSYTPARSRPIRTDTIYTIVYNSIPTDAYTFTLLRRPVQLPERRRRAAASSSTVNFTVPWGTDPFPVPLKPISPAGRPGLSGQRRQRDHCLGRNRYLHAAPSGQPDSSI